MFCTGKGAGAEGAFWYVGARVGRFNREAVGICIVSSVIPGALTGGGLPK